MSLWGTQFPSSFVGFEMEKNKQTKEKTQLQLLFSTHCDLLNVIMPKGLFWFYMILHLPTFS